MNLATLYGLVAGALDHNTDQNNKLKEDALAKTTTRESNKKLKPKPKTEGKSWQARNAARKEKQEAHAAKIAETTES